MSLQIWSFRVLAVCAVLQLLTGVLPSRVAAQAPAGGPDADGMFRGLDANGDGRLTMDEARPNNRQLLANIFQMAGKDSSAALSRQEFQQVFDRVRGGGGAPRNSNPPSQPTPPAEPTQTKVVSDSPLSGLLKPLDTSGDGKLSRTEWSKLSQLFAKRDADKNASLEGVELKGEPEDIDLSHLAKRLEANGDEKTTRTEWSRLSQLFGQLDTSRDGNLDEAELDAAGPESENVAARGSRNSQSNPTSRAAETGPSVWRGWIVNGRGENPNTGHLEMELTIAGNRMMAREIGTQRAPQGLGAGTFVMNGDGRTGTLDATQTEGQNTGRLYLGIFQIEGDVMRWCVSNRNGERPRDMATAAGTYLMVLRRQAAAQ